MAQDNTNFDPLAPLGPSVGKFNMDVTNPLNLDPFGFKKLDIEQVKLVDVIPNYGALTSPQRNIRENLVGSPPNRPGPKKDSSFEKSAQAADSYMRSIFQTNQDKNEYSRIYGYNAGEDGNNYYKRYAAYGSKKMAEVGFSPFRDNEALYNSRTTKWNDFTRMVNHSLLPGVWLGIKSNVEGTFDMLRGDFTSINLDNAAEYEKISNIGMSTKGGAFGFVNNALSSFGLSAGIIIETIAEQAATKAIEAGLVATGAGIPAAGALEVAADVSAAAKFGRVGKLFSNLDRSFGAAVKTLESSQAARSFWKVANTPVGKFINPLGNTLDAMNDIRKAQSFGNLTSLAKISKTAGGFYRDMKFINAAVTEGKLEGGMQQNKVYYDLYNLHYKDNGKAPSDKQMYDMMVQSERAGQENLAWNTGVIYLSNKLVFPNIAGGKGTASLLRAKTQEIVNLEKGKILFKTVKEEGKKVLKGEFTYVKNGIRGTLKGLREQGFKESVKSLSAKSVVVLGKYFKGNIAEGLQENFQETISEALGNYYVNTFNSDAVKAHLYSKGAFADASRSKASYFKDAWANQNPFTKQGFETFATGFIMGAFAYPINNLPSWASTGYNKMFRPEEYADYKLKRNTFGEGIAQTLTDLYNDNPAEFFNSKLFNLGNQEILTKIIQEGGRKNTLDAKDFALVSQVTTALRSGTLDLFKERVESFRDLTPEEFEDAVGNIPKGEGLKYQSRIDDIVKRMDEIKTNYEKINDKYVNPIDLSQYEKGTDAYKKAQLFSQAWEVAKMNAVFMGSSYQDAVKRMKDISTKIKSSKPLSKMTDSEIQLLLEPSRMSNERDILKEEIESQKNVLSPEELRKKQNKLKALEALSEAYKNYDKFQNNQVTEIVEKFKESGELEKIAEENNMSIDEAEAELRKEINRTNRVGENTNENRLELESNLEKAYKDYLKAIASSTGDIYLSEEADEAFEMILDSYKLGKEASILANYVNVLNNPRDFMNHVQRNYQWMNNLYNNRRDYFSNIVNQQLDNIELNALLNELADRNVYISEDEAAEFLRSSTIPTEFYDDTRKVVIKEGHPEYDQYAIFFERAAAVRKLNPKGRSADNTALNYTLARLNAEKEAALNALPKTEERVEKGNIDIPKGTKATIDDIDKKLSVGQYVSLKYRSGLRVKELILYKSNEGLRYNSPAGDIVNKVTVTQGFEAAKKYTLELVADQAAIDKINAEFTQKKIDAIQELTARAQSEKLTQASTYIPFTKNTKFELMDEALKKQLENAFNQYVEDTEGLADKLSEVSDEKLLSALDDFIQNNPRAEKVIEQYNAKMKEKLAAQQLDEVEPPVMQVRGKDQDFKDLDIKDIKANIKKIETDIKKLQGKTDLTDQEKENLAILEFNLALANKFLNYKLNFKESAKRSKVIKEVSKVIDQQGDITFDETTNQYTVNGNKLEKVNKEIERVISEKYQEKQRDQIAQIYNNTLAKNNSVDGFISELKKANLPGFTEDTYNELSEKLKALTGETAQSSLEPTTTPVSDIEAKKDDIERRRQEELKNPIKTTEGRKETAAYSGEKYTIQVFIGAFKTKYSVEVAQKDNTVATGYISKESLSKNSFDTYEEALEYANKIAKKDKENLNKINAKYDAELAALEQPVSDKKADIETYFSENTRSTKDSKYNPDLSGEGSMALMEQENELLELGADKIQAHGMAKGSIGEQFNDLLNILTNGLDAKRGGGMLYTAPLVISKELISAGAALGTSGGAAYKDGAFIILAKKGVNTIRNIDDIGGVLINQAVADTLPKLISKLKELFPNLSINSYSNSPTVISEINAKYDSAQSSLEPTTTTEDIEAKKADIEKRKNKARTIDSQPFQKNNTEGANINIERNSTDIKRIGLSIDKKINNGKTSSEIIQELAAQGIVAKANTLDRFKEFIADRQSGKTTQTFEEWYNETVSDIDAELAALEGKPTTAPKVKPEDLKINVTATAKKGGMELAQEQDSTIEKIDEGKFIRLTKADANDINGKYYTIDNGVLRVRVNGRDFAGRPGGATQLSVKVPDTFNEQIFADKLKNISHKGEVTTPEAIDQVVNDLRNAISESTGGTTTQVSTGDNIAQIENELKEVERQINNQTTQPTSDKTYQDLFNEKWPDASGYLTASPTKSEFNKEESKFIEGKHIFEIRPIGNNEFEYRVVNNRVSQNRASTNYDKFIQPTAQELNGPDGADTIVTVKPGILRKEGDKFIVEKEVQVFYANSSTINNKVGTTTAAPVKVDITELEARRAELLEKLKTAKFAPPAASTSQVSTEAPRTGFRTFNVPISKKEDIADVVAGALVPASEIFWDKNIQTTGSWLNSVQGETVGGQDYIEIAIDSLSEENRKIADELKESDTDFGGIKGVRIVLGINLTPEQAQKKSIEIANKFKQQDLLWYEPTTLQDKIDGLEKQKQRSSTPKTYDQEIQRVKDTWGTELKQGEYFDEATKTIWASKELYDKSKSLKTEPVTRRRISLDDVLSLVNERAFEQKAETETYITDQIKNFLADKEVKNDPTLLSQQAFDSLFGSKSILAELKEKANLGDIVIIPAKLTVFDIPAGVAGEINFLLVDREGNTTIVLVKMGDVNKWEEYDDETSDVSKKESYGLELVAAKNMLYNMTGINPKIVLLPLQISTDSATGRIETIESASPILVPGKIVAPVDPNQTTADGETLQIKINDIIPMRTAAGEPVIEEVVDEEQATIEQEVEDIAAQQRRLAKENKIAILDKIQTLRSRQQKLDTDLKKVNDILNYLDTIGNSSIELTADELTDIINSITALDQVTGQYLKSKFRKGRGKTSIKNQDIRDQFRREFVVIAGVVGRLEDLRKEKEILTAQVKDLNNQIDYYQNILDTEDLALFSRSDIKIKIAEIKKKINSLNRSIKTINDTILRTKKLLKEYIDGIKKLESQVGQQLQLIPDANYKPLSKEEVERLEKAVDNLENATLEDFNSIVKQFKNLRSRLSATMDVAELTPKVKELEIERINSLQESLKSYGKEVRYLNDILNAVSEESLTNKLSDKNSNGPKPTNTKNTSSTNQNKLDETVDKSKGEVISEISLGEILGLAEKPVKESVISEKAADIITRINKSTVDEIKEMLKDISDLTAYEVKVINDAAKSRIKSLTEEFKSEIKDQMNDIQETQYVTVQPIDDIPAGSLITITSIEGDNITFEVANSNEKKSVKFDNLNGKIMTQEEAKSKAAVETIEITPEAKSKIIESITAADSLTNADIDNIIDAVKDKDLDTLEEELYNKKIC